MITAIEGHDRTHEHAAMKPQPKWQDWGNLLVAGTLFVSPWFLGTARQTSSSWNAWLVGSGMVFFTVRTLLPPPGAYTSRHAREGGRIAWWQRVVDSCHYTHIAREQLVVGAWLLVAPWLLGFAASGAAAWTAWVGGSVTLVLAWWKLLDLRRGGPPVSPAGR